MSYELLINSLRRRIPWSVMSKILHHHSFPKGHGWDDTVKKLNSFGAEKSANKTKMVDKLFVNYSDHLIGGDKAIRFFKEKNSIINRIIEDFDKYHIPESLFKTNYPYLLDDTDLESAETATYLVDVSKISGKQVLVFCTKRCIKERVEIPPIGELAQYSEVIGFKEYYKQSFDVVVLDPQMERIEIRLDIGSDAGDRELSFNQIRRAFQNLVSRLTIKDYKLKKENIVNLFSAIDDLYRSSEGRVCELAFTTEGGSIKRERMRRSNECLRTEAYHDGGIKAVDGKISSYRIAATWEHGADTSLVTQPELLLPGYSRMLSEISPILMDADITNCAGIEDFNFVVNKLNDFLGDESKT